MIYRAWVIKSLSTVYRDSYHRNISAILTEWLCLFIQERAALRNSLKLATANLMLIKVWNAFYASISSLLLCRIWSFDQGPDPTEYYQERRLNRLNLLKPLEDDEIVMPGERGRFDDDY
jgi:hypothetical protein